MRITIKCILLLICCVPLFANGQNGGAAKTQPGFPSEPGLYMLKAEQLTGVSPSGKQRVLVFFSGKDAGIFSEMEGFAAKARGNYELLPVITEGVIPFSSWPIFSFDKGEMEKFLAFLSQNGGPGKLPRAVLICEEGNLVDFGDELRDLLKYLR